MLFVDMFEGLFVENIKKKVISVDVFRWMLIVKGCYIKECFGVLM